MTAPLRRARVGMTVNGEAVHAEVPVRLNLVDFLRTHLGLTGSHVGCEHGVCGACTVLVDGALVRGCLMLAVQADGCTVETIEGADQSGRLAPLQASFHARNALQCGFCTPGMLLTAAALLERDPAADRETVREALSGNLCRCTGYHAIVDAVQAAGAAWPQPAQGAPQPAQRASRDVASPPPAAGRARSADPGPGDPQDPCR